MKAIQIDKKTPILYLTVGDFLNLIKSEKKETPQDEMSEIFGVKKLKELTGYSKNTIYAKTSKNEIPHFKRDGRLFFRHGEIMDWLTANPVTTVNEHCKEMDEKLTKRSRRGQL
jgi:predicted DNA-binding transcriptional regulator AlpA